MQPDRRKLLRLGLGSALAVGLASTLAACSRDSLDPADMDTLLARENVPGASVALMKDGEPVWSASYGVKAAGSAEPVAAETRFQAASISKVMNALLVLALVRDGLLDLDMPINAALHGWQLEGIDADSVTVAMLLSHTGGTNVPGFTGYPPGTPLPTILQILDGQPPANSPPIRVERPPGGPAEYSGGGTTILQKLVSDLTGADYASLLHRLVLDPLAMTRSSIAQPPPAGFADFASGHDADGNTLPGGYRIHPELAAAGLWSTPSNLLRPLSAIIASLRGAPGAFLPQALARRMVTPVSNEMGLGVFSDTPGWFHHPGSNQGFRAYIRASYETGDGLAIMSNGDNGGVVNAVLRRLLEARL